MAVFDEHIKRTESYIEEMRRAGRGVREFYCSAGSPVPAPFRIGPGASPGLIMKSDMFLELGSPTAGSCAFVLYTDQPSLVQDGRIRLIGPDIQESRTGILPFGQVIVAAGESLGEADYHELVESQYVGDRIEGFMVKSMPGHIWGRISNDVAEKGFNFAFLGSAMRKLIQDDLPHVSAVEVIFVTSDKTDLQPLDDIGLSVRNIARAIKERRWKERGIDITECAFGGCCGSCPDRDVCDRVRELVHTG